ncbi:hypothetical protein L596_017921 [Steinernema carpocapsae]|uniref:Nuclear receptor domain-containing protein n=1 Tax=Steinernema carpocapsae TaxID=34508 RepID=A0A4U5N3J6_STECR|nr:hypothetical protein L596_017921 [Steinernema carpocapsae]
MGVKWRPTAQGFFKRWLQNQNTFVCRQGTDSCVIDFDTRNRCQYCRLQKCLSLGMSGQPRQVLPVIDADLDSLPQPTALQQILLDPKMEENDEFPELDLKPYEEEVEQARSEVTAVQQRMHKFERLWKKETDEYLAKKAEFEQIEARYLDRRDVYLEALENRKRKLENAKSDYDTKMRRLNDAREGCFDRDYF